MGGPPEGAVEAVLQALAQILERQRGRAKRVTVPQVAAAVKRRGKLTPNDYYYVYQVLSWLHATGQPVRVNGGEWRVVGVERKRKKYSFHLARVA
ncbi:MAG: hypothetical protein QXT28_06300 [Thermofilaceae archaeon]